MSTKFMELFLLQYLLMLKLYQCAKADMPAFLVILGKHRVFTDLDNSLFP